MSSALSWESSQPLAKVPAQSSDQNQRENTSSTIICLRSAGDHNSLLSEVGVKRSSHDELHAWPAGKVKICFIFHCICLREAPREPAYNTALQPDLTSVASALSRHTDRGKQRQEGDLRGEAAVFWQTERKRERCAGEDEDARTTVGPLVPDLELHHRRISCTNKAPLTTCAHTPPHIPNPQHSTLRAYKLFY